MEISVLDHWQTCWIRCVRFSTDSKPSWRESVNGYGSYASVTDFVTKSVTMIIQNVIGGIGFVAVYAESNSNIDFYEQRTTMLTGGVSLEW